MRGGSRSLNLSNAVAVGLYEALRQTGFENLQHCPDMPAG
jgi:tRNA (cytidine/uridine-2'-O-)-methyltransferase